MKMPRREWYERKTEKEVER
jgi:hypothetical protein